MNRLHIVCVVAVVLLHGKLAAQQSDRAGQSASTNAGPKQNRNEPPNALPASAALAIQSSLERIAAAQVAQANGGKSAEEKKREGQDLEAQQDMAYWAQAMFIATLVSAVVSAGATWLLYLTLRQSRRATFAALRAAVAGRQSVRVTSDTAKKQLRAYISIESIAYKGEPFNTISESRPLIVRIVNYGQTPAYAVTVELSPYMLSREEADESAPSLMAGPFICGPGQAIDLEIPRIEQIPTIYICGVIKYKDIHGEWWAMNVWHKSTGREGHFQPHGDQNRERGPFKEKP